MVLVGGTQRSRPAQLWSGMKRGIGLPKPKNSLFISIGYATNSSGTLSANH
jgi:hypothetical protein